MGLLYICNPKDIKIIVKRLKIYKSHKAHDETLKISRFCTRKVWYYIPTLKTLSYVISASIGRNLYYSKYVKEHEMFSCVES